MNLIPKPTFDMQYPSGSRGYWGYDHLNNFQGIHDLDLLPGRTLAHDNPDMRVMVLGGDADGFMKGVYYGNNSQRIPIVSGDSPVMVAPVSNPRIDVVYLTVSGGIAIRTGNEASNPAFPDLTSGDYFPTAAIYHRVGTTKVVNYADKDSYTGDSYIFQDLRPFYNIPRSISSATKDQNDRNVKNEMLNRLKLAQTEALAFGRFIDGWFDDFQDSTGIATSSKVSGDLITVGDKLRYSRNYSVDGTPRFRVVRSGTAPDGRYVVIGGKAPFDFLASKASVVVITGSGDNIQCQVSRNSGTTWNDVSLANDWFDGTYYYKSGINANLSGDYALGPNSGDYFACFIIPSGSNTTIEGYAVSLA